MTFALIPFALWPFTLVPFALLTIYSIAHRSRRLLYKTSALSVLCSMSKNVICSITWMLYNYLKYCHFYNITIIITISSVTNSIFLKIVSPHLAILITFGKLIQIAKF